MAELVAVLDATRDDPDVMVDGRPRLLFPYVILHLEEPG